MQDILIRSYDSQNADEIAAMARIWNKVVEDGVAFPQEDFLDTEGASAFFAAQTDCGVAVDTQTGSICGLYILHPNNVGRCGHIANASYAVSTELRGKHIGEKLVLDCLRNAREHGFRIMQFNAVVASNTHARHLYERIGFVPLGVIPGGFRMKDGHYEDICPYYKVLFCAALGGFSFRLRRHIQKEPLTQLLLYHHGRFSYPASVIAVLTSFKVG